MKKLSGRTLYYMAQYGKDHHLARNIFKSSIKILLITSILSSVGGLGLQGIKENLFAITPLIILLPALNDMIGDFGTIASTKFTTALYMRKIKGKWWKSKFVHKLFILLMSISIFSAFYIAVFSYSIAVMKGFSMDGSVLIKIIEITLISSVGLVSLIFLISITGCLWVIKKGQEPDNFLIPITTSVADLGSLLLLSFLVSLLF